jgi:hypothetical protein
MSTVYRAEDLRDELAPMALKEFNAAGLPPEDRAEALAWLAREAGLLSMLEDPRLPQLVAAASEGDRHYVAMPFLQGETLEERVIREGAQPEAQVLAWGRELASLLVMLHGQSPPVVHRDLKPANVLLRPDGSLILLDLGVARPLARGTPGTAVGTPGYAPPEQYQGMADERSDLYGLGATLHRALTGYNAEREAPFRHPPVRDLNPAVSDATASLVSGLLSIAPHDRPRRAQSALSLLKVAARGAYARSTGVLVTMYSQLIAALALAVVVAAITYHLLYPTPSFDGIATSGYRRLDALGDTVRVLLLFATGLVLLIPLRRARLRALVRRDRHARRHRRLAATIAFLAWLSALATWLIYHETHRWGDLVSIPAPLSLPVLEALGMVFLLGNMFWALRRGLARGTRRHSGPVWRFLLLSLVVGLAAPLLEVVAPPRYPGIPLAQPEDQAIFYGVNALASDGRGNLYVLDSSALRERTPNGVVHLLLDFSEACSPFYTPNQFTQMTVSPEGQVFLTDALGQFAKLRAPGSLALLPMGGLPVDGAAGAGADGHLYFSHDGMLYGVDTGGLLGIGTVQGQPDRWQPVAMVAGERGETYVVDGASQSLQEIDANGRLKTLAALPALNAVGYPPVSLTRDAAGRFYIVDGLHLLIARPTGVAVLSPIGGVYAAAAAGSRIYTAGLNRLLYVYGAGMDANAAVPVGRPGMPALACAS